MYSSPFAFFLLNVYIICLLDVCFSLTVQVLDCVLGFVLFCMLHSNSWCVSDPKLVISCMDGVYFYLLQDHSLDAAKASTIDENTNLSKI